MKKEIYKNKTEYFKLNEQRSIVLKSTASRMWNLVVWWKFTDVSEERIAYVFRVDE
jgi:hypothetical protein